MPAGKAPPLLWNLVVDVLIAELNSKGYYTQGYVDDVVIVIQGKYATTLSKLH